MLPKRNEQIIFQWKLHTALRIKWKSNNCDIEEQAQKKRDTLIHTYICDVNDQTEDARIRIGRKRENC